MSEKKIGPDKDASIEISQVGNGFIVRPACSNWFHDDRDARVWVGAPAEYLVFRSMAELQEFLSEHFSHRSTVTNPDRR